MRKSRQMMYRLSRIQFLSSLIIWAIISCSAVGSAEEDTNNIKIDCIANNNIQYKNSWEDDISGYDIIKDPETINNWKELAEEGIPKYQFYVGKLHHTGDTIPKDINKAIYWYNQSILSNYPAAMNNLAIIYEEDSDLKNNKTSFDLMCRAAKLGLGISQMNIARYYQTGRGAEINGARAVEWYNKAAEQGIADAMYNLGVIYYQGEYVKSDIEKAIELIKKSAEHDHPLGMHDMGNLHYSGINDTPIDIDKAINWYKKAANAGVRESYEILADIFFDPKEKWYNPTDALIYLTKSAEMKNIQSQINLGFRYLDGTGVTTDYKESFRWFMKAAEAGNMTAANMVAEAYNRGKGVEKNEAESFSWYLKSAKSGNLDAISQVSVKYYLGQGVEKNYKKSKEWAEKGQKHNNLLSKYVLGMLYKHGDSVDQNSDRSIEEFMIAFEQSDTSGKMFSARNIAEIYRYGIGTEINLEKAHKWYEIASELGDPESQNELGLMYGDGIGVRKDQEVALYWIQNSAINGFPMAQNNLGALYQNGTGIEQNIEKAIYWYQQAADQNIPVAVRNLGALYLRGEGVEADVNKGIELLEKAVSLGDLAAALSLATTHNDDIKDYKKAFKYYLISAEQEYIDGDQGKSIPVSQFAVANMYWKGIGVKQNYKKAVEWYNKAADNGMTGAKKSLAIAYIYGLGVEPDLNKARDLDRVEVNRYLESISENDNQLLALAHDYMFVVGDEHKAVELLEKIAKNGNIEAQTWLGNIYSDKSHYLSIDKDLNKSVSWYEAAISQGSTKAEVDLAQLYLYDSRMSHNRTNGFNLIQSASEKGFPGAYDTLSYAYEHGVGTPKNIDKSIESLLRIIDTKTSSKDHEDAILKIFKIQEDNNIFSPEMSKKAIDILKHRSRNGDHLMQLKLGKIYLNKKSKLHDIDMAKKYIDLASQNSIEANIYLYNYYYGHMGYEFNYSKVQKHLLKAVDLFNSKNADDDGLYRFFLKDKMIEVFHDGAMLFARKGMFGKAESFLRNATRIQSDANNLESIKLRRSLILATLSDDTDFSISQFKKIIEFYQTSEPVQNSIDIKLLFSAVNGVSGAYEKRHEHIKSAEILEDNMYLLNKIHLDQNTKDSWYKYFLLEMSRKYIRGKNLTKSKSYLNQYKNYISQINAKHDNTLNKMMERGISGSIMVEEGNVLQATNSILSLFSDMATSGVYASPFVLSFANDISVTAAEKGYHKESYLILDSAINLYKKFIIERSSNGGKIMSDEKNIAKEFISNYLHFADLSGATKPDQGFNIMQIASGLSSSESLIGSIRRSYMSRTMAVKSKHLQFLIDKRDTLIKDKISKINQGMHDLQSINSDLNSIEHEIQTLQSEVSDQNTNFSVWGKLLKPADIVQSSLAQDDALISVLVSENRIYVWLVTKQGVYRTSKNIDKSIISKHVESLRSSLDPISGASSDFPFESSLFLYDLIIKPFEKQLKSTDRLIVSPDPLLSTIPFSILAPGSEPAVKTMLDSSAMIPFKQSTRGISSTHGSISPHKHFPFHKVDWLQSRFAIAVVPSVYSFVDLQHMHGHNKDRSSLNSSFLGIGNPILDGTNQAVTKQQLITQLDLRGGSPAQAIHNLAPLPETEQELAEIAKNFDNSDILTRGDATEMRLRETNLSNYDVISFATHALVSDEIKDIIEPSIVLTPIDSSLASDDGLLTSEEITQLNITADIVLLSACNTAASDSKNSEGLSGLANSFFQAGAKSLLVSYWSVITESALALTTRMFNPSNKSRSYAHKHRNAVLDLLHNSDDTSKHHPSYWAPFSVVGVY